MERKKNAISGTMFGILLKVTQILFQFIIRTIFIRSLGAEYLGLNSLFSAVLQVLNLAELGVSSALVFSMYRPIAENDSEKICQLMNLYKRYYRVIGLVVFMTGVVLIPFLPHLIKGTVPPDINLYVIYAMNLAATVLSYWLFAYRNSLLVAHQRNDIISIITIVVNLCLYGLQITCLLIFKNYYLYLSLNIIAQIAINIITAITSKKFYPDYSPNGTVSKEEQKSINAKVRDLFTSRIGSVINHSADSIVISSFLGLELLAIYQNYYYIISALMAMFSIFFAACTAGIGNSLLVKDEKHNRTLLYNINHIVFMAVSFFCCCFVSVCQPFMKLWVGEDLMLDFSFVILFAVYLFAEEAPRTLIVFKDAGGIWRHDRFRPLLSATFNLMMNIVLSQFIGLYGIIISTISALMLVSLPWVVVNINNRLFNINIKKYCIRFIMYILVIAFSIFVSYNASSLVLIDNIIVSIILKILISGSIALIIFVLAFNKTEENKYVLQVVQGAYRKIAKKQR
ncbi:MAG: oligosaccharide flippase family protein [Lachnospiraceae bacterium]|nr:oligosaccharide flippase family protein [Lachnospiraceae bacterium]